MLFVSDIEARARKAVEGAHAACPCRLAFAGRCGEVECRCAYIAIHTSDPEAYVHCRWPGHAVIDRAVTWARLAQAERMIGMADKQADEGVYGVLTQERGRLRKEVDDAR